MESYYLGPPEPPAANEMGWKDTMQTPPGYVTEVVGTFAESGSFVYHCHILEHEENDMMRRMNVQ